MLYGGMPWGKALAFLFVDNRFNIKIDIRHAMQVQQFPI